MRSGKYTPQTRRLKTKVLELRTQNPELRPSYYLPSACRSDRHSEIKARAGSGRTLHPDGSLVHRHQGFGNEQTKLSPLSGGVGRRHFRELMEELFDVIRVNPTAGIGDRGLDKPIGVRLEIDGDAAAWRRELNRIANEIPDEPRWVCPNLCRRYRLWG